MRRFVAVLAVTITAVPNTSAYTEPPRSAAAVPQTHRQWLRQHRPWLFRWRFRTAQPDRVWYRNTAACESGNNPRAHSDNGLYHGAVQWLPSTWWSTGGRGDPHAAGRYEQAVRGVRLMRREGTGHWPNCG